MGLQIGGKMGLKTQSEQPASQSDGVMDRQTDGLSGEVPGLLKCSPQRQMQPHA